LGRAVVVLLCNLDMCAAGLVLTVAVRNHHGGAAHSVAACKGGEGSHAAAVPGCNCVVMRCVCYSCVVCAVGVLAVGGIW
jgi:hypothetical protein